MRVQLSPSQPFNIKSKKINRPFYKPFRKFDPSRPKANEQIRVPEVRVINENGENIGVISTQEALGMAKQAGLDLVEISKDAIPPVVKIIDIGKYIYQKDKSEREKKSKQKASELKIIKIGLATSEHDSLTKIKKLEEFLADGDKVKIEMFLKIARLESLCINVYRSNFERYFQKYFFRIFQNKFF
ncbi:translation initiation factor IF-3 [Candidatus Azambacteria bacterium]|nr:translation initiation factor IF-3 [Candidatus Azambacteria bacterium]